MSAAPASRPRPNSQIGCTCGCNPLTDSINELVGRELIERRPDEADRRRQLIELTNAGTALLDADRAERDAWLHATMRDNLTPLEFDLLMLVAPVLRKLAYADA